MSDAYNIPFRIRASDAPSEAVPTTVVGRIEPDGLAVALAESVALREQGVPLNAMRSLPPFQRPERAIEPGRLAKAFAIVKHKRIRRVEPGHYIVAGNDQPYYGVRVYADEPCDCKDSEFNPHIACKHFCAGRICDGDMGLIELYTEWMLKDEGFREQVQDALREEAA